MANKLKLRHPAVYSDVFIPIFADILIKAGARNILDPMAGTGKIALIRDYGYTGKITCNELEPEWAVQKPYAVDDWYFTDAADMTWALDNEFDAVVTSPVYGNRFSDHHKASDSSYRVTYTHNLGRQLHPENTGKMQWGATYREKHVAIYHECHRVIKPAGLMVVNISNHIRDGAEVNVAGWTWDTLKICGFELVDFKEVKTPRLRSGANAKLRVEHEVILVMRKK